MSERRNENQVLAQVAQSGHSLCWHCKSEVGDEPLCPSCVKIQPMGRDSDYFTAMGLPRKLEIDPRVLEPIFHALSRRFHPDRYRMASPRERMIALENSALLNQAYRTLKDPFERTAYLVRLEHGRESGGKDAPPQELFEEILEIQELLGEYKLGEPDERAALREQLESRRALLRKEQEARAARLTGELFRDWDALPDRPADPDRKEALLDQMRRAIGERSYLRRVLNSLDEALASRT